MAIPSAQDVANKWSQGMAGATAKYQAGVSAVTTAATQLAAQSVNKYLAGINQAVSSGHYANALNAVSLSDWQQAASTKGAPRLASGAQAAKPKFQQFLTQFLPQLSTIVQQVKSMPSTNYSDRQQRAIKFMDAVHALKGQL